MFYCWIYDLYEIHKMKGLDRILMQGQIINIIGPEKLINYGAID